MHCENARHSPSIYLKIYLIERSALFGNDACYHVAVFDCIVIAIAECEPHAGAIVFQNHNFGVGNVAHVGVAPRWCKIYSAVLVGSYGLRGNIHFHVIVAIVVPPESEAAIVLLGVDYSTPFRIIGACVIEIIVHR